MFFQAETKQARRLNQVPGPQLASQPPEGRLTGVSAGGATLRLPISSRFGASPLGDGEEREEGQAHPGGEARK